jgi:hypothetical protein
MNTILCLLLRQGDKQPMGSVEIPESAIEQDILDLEFVTTCSGTFNEVLLGDKLVTLEQTSIQAKGEPVRLQIKLSREAAA